MDTYTQREFKESIKKIVGFFSVCATFVFLFLSAYKYYLNPLSYINLGFFYGHSEAIFIWLIFGLIYIRRYYPWQFIFILIPIYLLSDTTWVIYATFDYPYYLFQTLLNPHWYFYYIELSSIVIIVILVFLRKNIHKPTIYQLTFFAVFSVLYIFIFRIPIVANLNNPLITIPDNIYWEMIWQIAFLIGFGNVFTREQPKYDIGWYFR